MTVAVQSHVCKIGLVSVSLSRVHPNSFSPCKLHSKCRPSLNRGAVRVRAQQQTEEKPQEAKFADSIGLPTEEGLFGFKPFPEVCTALIIAISKFRLSSFGLPMYIKL